MPDVRAPWMTVTRAQRRGVLLAALALLPLFFLGGGSDLASRSFDALWDLGHVLIFFLWGTALLLWCRRCRAWGPLRLVILGGAAALAVGGAIEVIQGQVGRTPSWRDVGLDLTGMLLALGVSAPALQPLSHCMRRVRHAVLALLLVWTLLPLGLALWDEAAQRRAFPTLISFDSALVLSRLEGDAPFRRVARTAFSSQALLQIDFSPGPARQRGALPAAAGVLPGSGGG
ncbi:MAG: hypothetical protein R6X06_07485, partial [Gammaproteobacteria bacterium]